MMRRSLYVVRSNVHMMNLDTAVNRLLTRERFIDVTLVCEGHRFHCHRLVLAASSPLFEELLVENPTKHPIVILPMDIKAQTLKALIDFIYKGQTNIRQNRLKDLAASAQLLQVHGLEGAQAKFQRYIDPGEDPDDMEEDDETFVLGQLPNNLERSETNEEELEDDHEHRTFGQEDTANESDSSYARDQRPKERIIDTIEIEDSVDVPTADEEDVTTETNATENPDITDLTDTRHSDKAQQTDDTEANPINVSNAQYITVINNYENGRVTQETKRLQPYTPTICPGIRETLPPLHHKSTKLINLYQWTRKTDPSLSSADDEKQRDGLPWLFPLPGSDDKNDPQSPKIQLPLLTQWNKNALAWIYPNLPHSLSRSAETVTTATTSTVTRATATATSTPATVPFLKFNSKSMAISVKNFDRTATQEKVKVVNMAMEGESEIEREPVAIAPQQQPETNEGPMKMKIELGETLLSEPNLYPATLRKKRDKNAAGLLGEKENMDAEPEAEDIICQPFIYDYDNEDNFDKDKECYDNEVGVCIDYDRLVAEAYGNMGEDHHQEEEPQQVKVKQQKNKRQLKPKRTTDETSVAFLQQPLLSKTRRPKQQSTLMAPSKMLGGAINSNYFHHHNPTAADSGKALLGKDNSVFNKICNSPPRNGGTHSPQTVILRNPRCNQPRHYSTDSLYNALMAVKYGESIYRASRQHEVPRKTLRNWMKRWDIKSQYPMPKQLKDAAKKKKQTETNA